MSNNIILNFIFNGQEIKIRCKRNELMKDIFNRYSSKIEKDIDKIYFIYNGETIKKELKLEYINKNDNNINILVDELTNDSKKEINFSNDIICPKCGENWIINIKDYKIYLNECNNYHIISDILLNEFNNSQKIDKSKIKCNDCKNILIENYNTEKIKYYLL